MDARDVRGGKRIRVQGAQAVFRQAILRVKTRRSRARLLAASPVSRRCLALGKSAGCKCVGYRGRKLTAPHAKGCGGKATHRPPDVHLRPRAGTFRRNPSQTERTVTPKSDATRTAHSPHWTTSVLVIPDFTTLSLFNEIKSHPWGSALHLGPSRSPPGANAHSS